MCLFSTPKKRNKKRLKRLEKSVVRIIRSNILPMNRKDIEAQTGIPSEILGIILTELTNSKIIEFCKVRNPKTGRFYKTGYRITRR